MSTRNFSRLFVMAVLTLVAVPAMAAGPFRFYPLTPCRLVDTRQPANAPIMTALSTRSFKIRGTCGLPATATAAALNVTVFTPSIKGHVRVFPSDVALPNTSTLNFAGGENAVANGAIVPMPADTGSTTDLSIYLYMIAAGNAHMIIDVTGSFQ
jgi:hypothetical protein